MLLFNHPILRFSFLLFLMVTRTLLICYRQCVTLARVVRVGKGYLDRWIDITVATTVATPDLSSCVCKHLDSRSLPLDRYRSLAVVAECVPSVWPGWLASEPLASLSVLMYE
jgi:hypothetical protein